MSEFEDLCTLKPTVIEDDDDDDSEGWSEMDVECESILTCLFCPKTFKTMAVALEHCKSEHGFDLLALKKKFNMDCYSYICLVNYVRKEGVRPEVIISYTHPAWSSEAYLSPVLPEDPWLMFDFEGLESPFYSRAVSPEHNSSIKKENGMVTISEDGYQYMLQTVKRLKAQIQEQDTALALASEQMQLMRTATQKLLEGAGDEAMPCVGKLRITDDHSYFSSYSHVDIHHAMLTDKPRTISYRDAILKNAGDISGKVVLDVGCGSSILSMFCAQAGAAKVIGVDQSDIIYHAMDVIRENGLETKIDLLKGRIEEVMLPVSKVDVIVSEWMGYFLLFEGMLDAVILARDKFLPPNGLMLPNRSTLSLVGISDPGDYEESIGFWSDVYGYKMSTFRKEVLEEAVVTTVNTTAVATTPSLVLDLNLITCTIDSTNFTSDFCLQCLRDCSITAICGFFDVAFELPNPVVLSTSPHSPKTHWRQTIFYLPQPISVTEGSSLTGKISCKRKGEDKRSLVVNIAIQDQNNTYYIA